MILVTGGTGLLGSRLLFDLASRGEKVRAIKRSTSNLDLVRRVFSYYSDSPGELLFRIEWVEADILDIDSLMEAMGNVSQVYHVAGFVSFDPGQAGNLMRNNVDGTRNIVNACLAMSVKKLCYVSSTSALGSPDPDGYVREKSIYNPKEASAYSISKYNAELEIWRGIEEGLDAVIVNPSIIIGPGFWDRGSSVLFSVVYRGMKFYTEGVTGYVSVEDVSAAMIAIMKSHYSAERFILSSENVSYREILDLIAESLRKKRPSVKADQFLTDLLLVFSDMKAYLGGKRLITKETAASSRKRVYFSNEKFSTAFNVEFIPVRAVIQNTGRLFRKDIEEGWLDGKARKWGQPQKTPH